MLELVVRGSVMFRFLFLVFRIVLRRDGRRHRRNMRRESISDEELMSKVRGQGLEDLSRVKRMYLESDGEISLIRRPGADDADSDPPRKKPAR